MIKSLGSKLHIFSNQTLGYLSVIHYEAIVIFSFEDDNRLANKEVLDVGGLKYSFSSIVLVLPLQWDICV